MCPWKIEEDLFGSLEKNHSGWLQSRDLGNCRNFSRKNLPPEVATPSAVQGGGPFNGGGEPFVKEHRGIAKPLLRSTHFTCYFEGYHLLCNAGNLRGSC